MLNAIVITNFIKRVSFASAFSSSSPPCPVFPFTTSQYLPQLQPLLCNAQLRNNHTHAVSAIKSPPNPRPYLRFGHSPSSVPTTCQSLDQMPHRVQTLGTPCFYHVIDLIKFCDINLNIVYIIMVHCLALKVGALAHLPNSTSLLVFYSRAGSIGSSVVLFDEIVYKDVVLWNAMLTVAIEHRYFRDALNLFREMMEKGKSFDSATLLILVSSLATMKESIQGRVLHGLSFRAGMLSDTFLCNALIDMYAKCTDLRSSEHLFLETSCRDLVSWNSIVSGCLYNNHPEKCLSYFSEMVLCGKQPDKVGLSCAIAACTSLGERSIGQVIHGWGIKLGYDETSHNSVANSLISLYSQCGDIDAAEVVFRGTKHKDVVSWNAMIDGFASDVMIVEALHLLHEMQSGMSAEPDTVTLVIIIPLCAELMLLREGKSAHAYATRRKMEADLSVTNSLIYMYLKCDSVKEAEILFHTMPETDLVTWNTFISGYSQNGYADEARMLFRKLLQWCSQCSLSTLLAVLSSCDSPECLQFGKSIHCWQVKLGYSSSIVAINSLIFMYINCGDVINSFSLLLDVFAIADTACWNTIIAGYTKKGYYQEALGAFRTMREESLVNHDSITLGNAVLACGNLELPSQGKLIHGLALKTPEGSHTRVQNALISMYGRFGEIESARLVFYSCLNRNLCSWNCMISALSQNKDAKRALELFHGLDFEPNEISISAILSSCTQLGVLRLGKHIHGFTLRKGFEQNSYVSAALLDMYSNCGRLDIALQIFQHSPEKSIAAWNSMISAYGFHSIGQKSIETFHEMVDSGSSPTKSTFISLLSACSHSGLINEGLWYYDHMFTKFGVEPVTEHHVCMVDILGRSGRLHEAYEFIRQLPTRPESGVWGALLSSCCYHGNVEMGREVAEILFDLDPENVGYYVSLFNMYVAAGRWSDAVELRAMIDERHLKKPAGYSLIDAGLG